MGHAEDLVLREWVELIGAGQRDVLAEVCDLPVVPDKTETVVGSGYSWEAALEDVEWADGDVLVVGSSSGGALSRVFLGSRASKIVRHSAVPVVVVPREAAEDLAEQAENPA